MPIRINFSLYLQQQRIIENKNNDKTHVSIHVPPDSIILCLQGAVFVSSFCEKIIEVKGGEKCVLQAEATTKLFSHFGICDIPLLSWNLRGVKHCISYVQESLSKQRGKVDFWEGQVYCSLGAKCSKSKSLVKIPLRL